MTESNKKYRICIYDDCNSQASFNFEGLNKLIYCSKHKLNNMINLKHIFIKIVN